ncbi:hypothetical protein GCM10017673_10600 [Streptosporangium violaceochromogenes]|nr:hypothetical protein GCM10017673_10600 [Streptosporangium violaceochromogenes]
MGAHPCRRRAARLTAGALLTLQISFIALGSDGSASASADGARAPLAVVAAGLPAPARVHPVRRAPGAFDIGVLETAQRYTLDLYRRATALREQMRIQEQSPTGARATIQAEAREGATRRLPSVRLGHIQAAERLREAGLRWKSSGHCTDRQGRYCTSLEAVRTATVADVIALKRRSGCPIVITGGTEIGHAPGRYSHHAGYKLDISPNRCISGYIKREYPYRRVRGDGARLYGDSGTVYARESDHWDILFR